MEFLFHAQLRLARDHDLPVVLHVRRAQDQVLKGLRRFGIQQGIAHAFNGSLVQAQAYLKQGMKLGFGGTPHLLAFNPYSSPGRGTAAVGHGA